MVWWVWFWVVAQSLCAFFSVEFLNLYKDIFWGKKTEAFYCNNKRVMAAFYSLCTEIKTLYLASCLPVCFVFVLFCFVCLLVAELKMHEPGFNRRSWNMSSKLQVPSNWRDYNLPLVRAVPARPILSECCRFLLSARMAFDLFCDYLWPISGSLAYLRPSWPMVIFICN